MPLSRSISRTASMISWLMSHLSVDQVRPHDLVVRNLGLVDFHAALVCEDDLAAKLALARAELHAASDDAGEVLGPAQRALDAGGRDVNRVLAQVVAQQVGDARAQPVIDSLGMVDEDGEPVRALQLEREHLYALEAPVVARADPT